MEKIKRYEQKIIQYNILVYFFNIHNNIYTVPEDDR